MIHKGALAAKSSVSRLKCMDYSKTEERIQRAVEKMGCAQSVESSDDPFLPSSPQENFQRYHDEVFGGESHGSVTLTTSLLNQSMHRFVLLGAHLGRGHKVDRNTSKIASAFENGIILAASNGDDRKFTNLLRGTNGIALWTIEGSAYVLALAWNIPKYRTLAGKANSVSVGLIMNTGLFDSPLEAAQIYLKDTFGKPSDPSTFENYGNFIKFSCASGRSGFSSTMQLRNNHFVMEAQLTSGRQAHIQIHFRSLHDKIEPSMYHREHFQAMILAYKRCFCDLEEYNGIRYYPTTSGQLMDDTKGYGLAMLFEPLEKGIDSFICQAKLDNQAFVGYVIDDGSNDKYSLVDEIKHREWCSEGKIALRTFKAGKVKLNQRDVLYSARTQNCCIGLNFRRVDSKDWIKDLIRLLSLDKLNKKLNLLLENDIKRMVNHKIGIEQNEYFCYGKDTTPKVDKALDEVLDEMLVEFP